MKKFIYSAVLSLGLLFASCDYVSSPYPEKNANITSDTLSCDASFPVVSTHIKKILIEDYTGHTCPNCPRAARAITTIDTTHPGKIIALGVHVGGFAVPNSTFTADYRTTVGNTYDAFFGASAFGLPEGMFSRKRFDAVNNTHLFFYTNFPTYFSTIQNEPSVVDLQLNLNYDPSTRKICCAVRDSFLTAVTGTYKLVMLISQDSIIDWQDDVDALPQTVQYYVHRHVLRDAVTPAGAWGEPLIGNNAAAGLTQVRHFAYNIPAAYNNIPCDVTKCHIVAFIYNTSTYEIIQAEEAKVTQ